MSKQVTKEQWQNHFKYANLQQILREDSFAKSRDSANWILSKEVRIYKLPSISSEAVKQVALGIDDLIKDISLDFSITDAGVSRTVANAVNQSAKNARVDPENLSRNLVLAKGSNYAKVVIFPQYLSGGDGDWGYSVFSRGCLFIALPDARQKDLDFLRKVSKHEAGHLFGYRTHHDSVEVTGYNDDVDCNMLWRSSTKDLCDKCKDAIIYFWSGLEENSGEKFFK